jgi:predicted extracellular nuclease
MNSASYLLLIALLLSNNLKGLSQNRQKRDRFTIMFYNVENLFDTINDPNKLDDEFTPSGSKKWNTERSHKKIDDLSKVIAALDSVELPEIVCLAEIENNAVLKDLISTKGLKKGKYSVIHEESPDIRGIDVALLYRRKTFREISHRTFPVLDNSDKKFKTRDILYVKGIAESTDTLNIFVNHWSSRIGGEAKSEPKRLLTAAILRHAVDSLKNISPTAKIIIVGDFNDEPTNKSINRVLIASDKRKNIYKDDLFNLMYDMHNIGNEGTYYYKGNWNMLDNLIVSYSLLNQEKGFSTGYNGGRIFKQDWMLFHVKKTNVDVPNRTYGGNNYYGGISDHLPVFVTFKRNGS